MMGHFRHMPTPTLGNTTNSQNIPPVKRVRKMPAQLVKVTNLEWPIRHFIDPLDFCLVSLINCMFKVR